MSIIEKSEVPNWLIELVGEIKKIEYEWKEYTFRRYRECGQLILESGYEKGKWNDLIKKQFLEITGYSNMTFNRMVVLGKMNELEFAMIIEKYKSLYAWTHPIKSLSDATKEPKESIMEELKIPISDLNLKIDEQKAINYYKSLDGEYYGCFFIGKVNKKMLDRLLHVAALDEE